MTRSEPTSRATTVAPRRVEILNASPGRTLVVRHAVAGCAVALPYFRFRVRAGGTSNPS